jgi:eukaryotic-like serine/threonine-protein kinase
VTEPADEVVMRELEGQTVGGYVLQEYLGEGAFGGVFLSEQLVLGQRLRRVALKLSRRTGMTASAVHELFGESFLLARSMDEIKDSEARQHLVHVYHAGITDGDGRAFLTMEYVPGTTLADRFARQEKVDAPQLTKWATQIAKALRGLHGLQQPVVHRDLKPDNVLLGMDNLVRLVDFGLAGRMVDLNYVPGVAGTLAYMSPETSQGASTPASDVYSLGLLMYEGLTGEHPFRDLIPPVDLPDERYSDWLYETKRGYRAVPPSALSNTVTPKLDAIVLRCLEFEPDRRFADAGEFLAELAKEGPTQPPVAAVLRDLRRDGSTKNRQRARQTLEERLAANPPEAERFDLLRQLGEVLGSSGDHADAARRFGEAWKLTEHRAILRDSRERDALLTQLADAHRKAGNDFHARRYDALRGGGP